MYQMTHITAERGALTNDDRLDALAMAVQYWVDEMARLYDQSSMGLAMLTGHNAADHTLGSDLRW